MSEVSYTPSFAPANSSLHLLEPVLKIQFLDSIYLATKTPKERKPDGSSLRWPRRAKLLCQHSGPAIRDCWHLPGLILDKSIQASVDVRNEEEERRVVRVIAEREVIESAAGSVHCREVMPASGGSENAKTKNKHAITTKQKPGTHI
jgi:hypothetical protein